MISYGDYIKEIPKETASYVRALLDFLYYDKIICAQIRNNTVELYGTKEAALYKALYCCVKKLGHNLKDYIDVYWRDIRYQSESAYRREEEFKRYRDIFAPYKNIDDYSIMSPEDIVINFLKEYLHVSENIKKAIYSEKNLLEYLNKSSNDFKRKYKEELNGNLLQGYSIEIINYLTTLSEISTYLKGQNIPYSEKEIDYISFLLSIFYYKHVSSYNDVYNEQKRIINYLKNKGITKEAIEKTFGIKLDGIKLDVIDNVEELHKLCKNSFINEKNNTIGLLFKQFVNDYLTKKAIPKKILNNFDLTVDSFKDINDVIDESFYQSYYSEEKMYNEMPKDVVIKMHRLNRIYTYLLINRNKLNPDYISNNQEVMVLSILLLSYETSSNANLFFLDKGMTLDKVLEVVGLPKKDEFYKEIDNTVEMESLIGRFYNLIHCGVNSGRSSNNYSIDDLLKNILSKNYSNTTFINALYQNITGDYLKGDYRDTIDKHIKDKQRKAESALEEKLLSNVSMDVCKYLKMLCGYYRYYDDKNLKPEDKEQLSIILAALRYDPILSDYFESIGFTRPSICDSFGVYNDFKEPEINIRIINGPLKKYIFDREPSSITVYSILENAFNPKFKNSLKLREALDKRGKVPEDFLSIKSLVDEYTKAVEKKNNEKTINDILASLSESFIGPFEIMLKVYDKLESSFDKDTRVILAIIYGILISNNRYAVYFNNNDITIDSLSNALKIDPIIFKNLSNYTFVRESVLAFQDIISTDYTNYDDVCIIRRVFDNTINHSDIIREICNKLGIKYSVLKDEVINRKEKEITPEQGMVMLNKEEAKPIEGVSIPSITEYGLEVSKHFKYINNSLHELIFNDSISGSVTSVNDAIGSIITEEETVKKVGFFKSLFTPEEELHQTVKKYNPDKIGDLEVVVDKYLVVLKKELQGYEYIKKYIELYLLKLQEYLNNLKRLSFSVSVSNVDIKSIDDILDYTKALDQKSVKDILDGKISTFETMILLMKQELVSVHQAIINHFITINSLELSRSAIIPLLATEVAISIGNNTEASALNLSNDLIALLHSVVNKNYDSALANLEKLKTTSMSDELLKKLDGEVTNYLSIATSSQELIDRINARNDGQELKRC